MALTSPPYTLPNVSMILITSLEMVMVGPPETVEFTVKGMVVSVWVIVVKKIRDGVVASVTLKDVSSIGLSLAVEETNSVDVKMTVLVRVNVMTAVTLENTVRVLVVVRTSNDVVVPESVAIQVSRTVHMKVSV